MNLLSGIAIYFILWWLCLFAVLPFGVRGQHETDAVEPGTEPGAPVSPMLFRKVIATTLLAGIIFAGVYLYFEVYELSLEDLII
jgi:predicted secreted protein